MAWGVTHLAFRGTPQAGPVRKGRIMAWRTVEATWLPEVLDPSPITLSRVIHGLKSLSLSMRRYCEIIGGKPAAVILDEEAAETFHDLLQSLRDLLGGVHDSAEDPLAFNDWSDFKGWPCVEELEGYIHGIRTDLDRLTTAFSPVIPSSVGVTPNGARWWVYSGDKPSDETRRLAFWWTDIEGLVDGSCCTSESPTELLPEGAEWRDTWLPENSFCWPLDVTFSAHFQHHARLIGELFEGITSRSPAECPGPLGRRWLRIPANELPFADVEEDAERPLPYPTEMYRHDPFEAVLDVEAQTGTCLADGGNPLWFVYQYDKFLKNRDPANGMTFAKYCESRFPRRVSVVPDAGEAATSLTSPTALEEAVNDHARPKRRKIPAEQWDLWEAATRGLLLVNEHLSCRDIGDTIGATGCQVCGLEAWINVQAELKARGESALPKTVPLTRDRLETSEMREGTLHSLAGGRVERQRPRQEEDAPNPSRR
jgi:hypothetical protein